MIGCTCFSLLGCVVVDRLPDETKLRDVQRAADINGVFKNKGSSDGGKSPPLLSDTLFPLSTFSETPSEIRISSETESTLRCEAISHGKVVSIRDLVVGEDFRLTDGGVAFDRRLIEAMTGGGVAVEIGARTHVIRLTEKGDAVLTSKRGGVGLAFFIIPIAEFEVHDGLFERMKDDKPVVTNNHESGSE